CRAAWIPDCIYATEVEEDASLSLRGKSKLLGSLAVACLAAFLLTWAARVTAAPGTVDEVFAKYRSSTPGCVVGVGIDGRGVVIKGYGTADLEHDVANGEETIFEAGSVSKQFTAAAILLLARDGKLTIDDPVRKYISELPEYPAQPEEIPPRS